jgi:uncharacterized membrane protein YqjE
MSTQDSSITDFVKQALRDAQELVRGEIALAKAEAREEVGRVGIGLGLIASAMVSAVIGVVFLMTTIAWGISEGLAWPVWSGFGIVTIVMLLIAAVLGIVGKKRFTAERHMPRTVDTLKENIEWMRARTS